MGLTGRTAPPRQGAMLLVVLGIWSIGRGACCYGSVEVIASSDVLEPGREGRVSFACQLPFRGKLTFELCDAAHGVARTLAARQPCETGGHAFVWDGRLDDGSLAPAGTAYYPMLALEGADGRTDAFDAGLNGGAQLSLPQDAFGYDRATSLFRFRLPVAARVCARAGVRDGPVLKTFSSWSAFPAGVTTLAWDGWDEAHLVQVASRPDFILSIQAMALPSPSVVIRGQSSPLVERIVPKTPSAARVAKLAAALMAKTVPIVPTYLSMPAIETQPSFRIDFQRAKTAGGAATVAITPSNGEAERLAEERYEVVLCIDLVRVAEDEQGHLPAKMAVPLDNLAPGRHVVSISVVTASGRHSTVSTAVTVGAAE